MKRLSVFARSDAGLFSELKSKRALIVEAEIKHLPVETLS